MGALCHFFTNVNVSFLIPNATIACTLALPQMASSAAVSPGVDKPIQLPEPRSDETAPRVIVHDCGRSSLVWPHVCFYTTLNVVVTYI